MVGVCFEGVSEAEWPVRGANINQPASRFMETLGNPQLPCVPEEVRREGEGTE